MSVESPVIIEVSPEMAELAVGAEQLNHTVFERSLDWDGNNRVFVMTENDQVVGVTNANINPDTRTVNIRFMATDPTRRSRGIGGAMLCGVLVEAENAGCTKARVMPFYAGSTPEDANRLEKFYENHGFTVHNPDLIGMSKTLNPKQ